MLRHRLPVITQVVPYHKTVEVEDAYRRFLNKAIVPETMAVDALVPVP